jgi:hypothetical protein
MGLMSAGAQTPVDYAARVASVEQLKGHIGQREARLEGLRQDLLALDARTEQQIDQIVKTLSGLKDSADSKTRVAKVKGEVTEALVRTIWIYRQKRVEIFERMRKDSAVPQEDLERTLKVFDQRIGKRVEQIVELARSFPGQQDVKKYESYGTSYYDGFEYETLRVSDEWKQNRRDGRQGEAARDELLKGLAKSLETQASRRAALADSLATRKLSETDRAAQQQELGRIDATLDFLRAQSRTLALPSESAAATRTLSGDEAHDGEQALDDLRADLARDFSDIMRKYADLDAERTRVAQLKANLAAREQWLREHPQQ